MFGRKVSIGSRLRPPVRQRGSTLVEWLIVATALVVIWKGTDAVLDSLREHNDEYTWSMSHPH